MIIKSPAELGMEAIARFEDRKECAEFLLAALVNEIGRLSEKERILLIKDVQSTHYSRMRKKHGVE